MSAKSVVSATWVFLLLTGAVIAFQLALVVGAPWGEFTMGGRFPGKLPPPMRLTALVSAGLLAAFAAIVASRAGLALPRWRRASRWLIWVVLAYSVIGVVLNAITPSGAERAIWLPVSVVLAVCSLIVAVSGGRTAPDSRMSERISS